VPVGASITVNASRGDGQVSGTTSSEESKILKQILAELQKSNKQRMVTQRKQESGLIGGGTLTGAAGAAFKKALAAALFGPAGVAAVAIGGLFAGGSSGDIGEDGRTRFAKVRTPEGIDKVARIDRLTGDILELISMEDALREGIVDKAGNIERNEANKLSTNQKILSTLEQIDGIYILTEEAVANVQHLVREEEELQKRINAAKKAIAENLERKAGRRQQSVSEDRKTRIMETTINGRTFQGGMSVDPGAVFIADIAERTRRQREEREARDRLQEQIRVSGETQTSRTTDYFPYSFGGFSSGGNN